MVSFFPSLTLAFILASLEAEEALAPGPLRFRCMSCRCQRLEANSPFQDQILIFL